MWHEERYQRIRGLLKTFGQASIERITKELGVSRETVRRDLLELEGLGEIRRVHGGAVLAGDGGEPPIGVRATTRVREKRLIAKKVASLVESGHTLFIDAGSTTAFVAEALAGLAGLTVITNSVDVALKLATGQANGNQVQFLGGRFGSEVPSTHGASTVAEIVRYQADLAILSPVGVDGQAGASSFLFEEAEIARAMSASARRTLIAADHAKVGVRSRMSYCPPERIDVLVTDGQAAKLPAMEAIGKTVGRVEYA